MSPSSLKRINKEIKNFNEKTYSTNIFSHKLLEFLGNLNLTIISVKTNNNSNNDEYFLLIKNSKNKKLLELKFPEFYPFKPYSVISYDSNIKNITNNNRIVNNNNNNNNNNNSNLTTSQYKFPGKQKSFIDNETNRISSIMMGFIHKMPK